MATNHTTNYNLNLWEPQDDFLRSEFNENTQKIDAMFGPDNLPWVIGSYTSTTVSEGGEMDITLGFRPKLLIVVGEHGALGAAMHTGDLDVAGATDMDNGKMTFSGSILNLTEDGFHVNKPSYWSNYTLADPGIKYVYFAIR